MSYQPESKEEAGVFDSCANKILAAFMQKKFLSNHDLQEFSRSDYRRRICDLRQRGFDIVRREDMKQVTASPETGHTIIINWYEFRGRKTIKENVQMELGDIGKQLPGFD